LGFRGEEKDKKLNLFGGRPVTRELAKVYIFDTEKSQWEIPKLSEDSFVLNKILLTILIILSIQVHDELPTISTESIPCNFNTNL
jgi:hypothetical protein